VAIILGIDPGSRITGFGVVEQQGSTIKHIAHGHIPTRGDVMADRLLQIYEKILEVVHQYQPQQGAIEQVFVHINPQSALKLGQARGAALVAMAGCGLALHEYSAKQIKQSVVGYGGADKAQVQHMVRCLLKLTKSPQVDAADGLAAAICHCHSQQLQSRLQKAKITAGSK
jgi:crossover junction endodeoxyribonuclease RuvC